MNSGLPNLDPATEPPVFAAPASKTSVARVEEFQSPRFAVPRTLPLACARPPAILRPALLMGASVALLDLCMLCLAALGGFHCWSLLRPIPLPGVSMGLAILFAIVSSAFYGLYPGIGMAAADQIRRLVRSITLGYLLLIAATFMAREWSLGSQAVLLLSWTFSVTLAPAARSLAGQLLHSRPWWGMPVMILGAGKTANQIIRGLASHGSLGYRPVICLDDDPGRHGLCAGVPVLGTLAEVAYFAETSRTRCAIVAMPELPREKLLANLERWSQIFPKIIVVPDLLGVATLWTESRDMGGILGLRLRFNLLSPWNRMLKRGLDAVLSSIALLVSMPLFLIAALWIKRVSPGPAFYCQEREGEGGQLIRVLKLRTMYPDAERMLESYLAEHAEARLEWERFCKLRRDPRVLPGVGAFLRQTSLDELPQLWNVLRGEMSMVGPRPFPRYHNQRFDPTFRRLRLHVAPGLTGLWQVTARSDGDLEMQAALDSYYIRNWSPWLDLYILIRTIHILCTRKGAY